MLRHGLFAIKKGWEKKGVQYCLKLFVNLQWFFLGENSDSICGLTKVNSCLLIIMESSASGQYAPNSVS